MIADRGRQRSIFDPPSSILDDVRVSLRFFRRRGGRLLLDDFYYFAGIGLLFELQDEILGFDRIAFAVEFDGPGDAFEPFDFPHGGGYLGAARFLAADWL